MFIIAVLTPYMLKPPPTFALFLTNLHVSNIAVLVEELSIKDSTDYTNRLLVFIATSADSLKTGKSVIGNYITAFDNVEF